MLRPGNAGSNTAADHIAVLDLALGQLDQAGARGRDPGARRRRRRDARADRLLPRGAMRFSFGFDLTERVREAIAELPESAWEQAIRADGSEREHSQVGEITDRVDLSAWPEGSRLIARRTKLKRRRPAVVRRPRRLPPGGLPHRPARRRCPSSISPPRPRPGRGPHPPGQGLRAREPAVPEPSSTTRSGCGW